MKVIVIGAGASGMVAAITAFRNGADVTILERNSTSGKKILVTGNGKCNYFNEDFCVGHYNSTSSDKLDLIINDKNKNKVLDFFRSIGVIPRVRDGYYYPYSNQAVSIVNSLLLEIKKLGISIINDCYVKDIISINNKYKVVSNDKDYICDKVIIATGSYAYYSYSDINSYDLAKRMNLDVVKPLPALVQLRVDNNITKKWAGVRVSSKIKLLENNNIIREEDGEVMFTNYGISGICAMQLSGIIARGLLDNNKYDIVINFVPSIALNVDDMINYLDDYNKHVKDMRVIEILDNLVNYKLGNILVGDMGEYKYSELSYQDKYRLGSSLVSFKVRISGTNSYREAQVCSGGVNLDDINIMTMESKKNKGLYVVGELLDITGDCGGYNLGFAWLSGIIAGNSCIKGDNSD